MSYCSPIESQDTSTLNGPVAIVGEGLVIYVTKAQPLRVGTRSERTHACSGISFMRAISSLGCIGKSAYDASGFG